jgi:hypothetical protein
MVKQTEGQMQRKMEAIKAGNGSIQGPGVGGANFT